MEMKRILLVLSTVVITISSSILLDYGAKNYNSLFISIIFIFLVLGINYLKFRFWGFIHKNYNLSNSYPLTSLFFPLIYIISIIKGQSSFEVSKTVGVLFILIGIFILGRVRSKNV